jgi:acetyl/propionyl-CoA carboxylase alpha subunit
VLHRYRHGRAPGVRWEDGIGQAAEVSPFYDPLLAKVIAHAPTRREAAARLARALASAQVHGTATNASFLVAALRSPAFLAGQTRTDFIARHPELLTAGPPTPEHVHLAAAVAVSVGLRRRTDALTPHAPPGFRLLPGHPDTRAVWVSAADGGEREIAYRLDAAAGSASLRLTVDGARHELSLRELGTSSVRVRDGAREWPCSVAVHDDGSVWVNDPDGQRGWHPRPRLPSAPAGAGGPGPVAGMAGVVAAVRVRPGDAVTAGQQLVVVEAMKMEWPAVSAIDGIVETVHVEVGQYVDAQAVLVTLTPRDAP